MNESEVDSIWEKAIYEQEDCSNKTLRIAIYNAIMGEIERITKTPVQHINDDVLIFTKDSLQEYDNEVIEKCAKICDEMNNEYGWGKVAANTIRLLKGKQNE